MDSVGADEDVASGGAAIGKRDGDAIRVLLEAIDMGIQPEACIAEAAEKHVEQIGAMDVVVRRTEVRLCPRAERRVVETVAIIPGAVVPSLGIDRHARQCLAEAERAQNPRGIGADLDASANLAKGFSLLEQQRLDAALPERQRGGDAADATAGDEDFELVARHERAAKTGCPALDRPMFIRPKYWLPSAPSPISLSR